MNQWLRFSSAYVTNIAETAKKPNAVSPLTASVSQLPGNSRDILKD